MTAADRKARLRRLDLLFVRSPIDLITACTENRRKLLATATANRIKTVCIANAAPAKERKDQHEDRNNSFGFH